MMMPFSVRFTSRIAGLLLATAVLGACSFPGVYKLDIPQGNVITQDMVDQLKPGMTKRQVRFIMGTPLLVDSFNEERWDYFYSLKTSENEYSRERLTMFFVEDRLHHMKGNFRPGAIAAAEPAGDFMEPGRSMALPPPVVLPPPPKDTPVEVYPVPPTDVHEVENPPAQ